MYKNVSISYTETYADGEFYTDWVTYYAQSGDFIYGGERRGYGVGALIVCDDEKPIDRLEAKEWICNVLTNINENCTIETTNKENVILIDITHQRYQE